MDSRKSESISPRIVAAGTANPPFSIKQKDALRLLAEYYKGELFNRSFDVMEKVFVHPCIQTRYLAVDSLDELVTLKNEDPDIRVQRFTRWSVALSTEAVHRALQKAAVQIEEVTALIVNTCTGYICPGIATYLIETCGFSKSIKIYDLVGTGCAGAVPNIQLAEKILAADPEAVVVCVSVEICTATFEMGNDMSLIVSNAIFGDGAAAVVIKNDTKGFQLKQTQSYCEPAFRDEVRYIHKEGRLHNRLAPHLPETIGTCVPPVITSLLEKEKLGVSDVKHWAIHPGGDKMISTIQEKLHLTEIQMHITRDILRRYGNMSSPTVLFALEQIMQNGVNDGEWCLVVAYGAGLSVHAYLLQA